VKECDPYLGRSHLMPERATMLNRREKSAVVVVAQVGSHKGITKRAKDLT
jgi:hypothetical protein